MRVQTAEALDQINDRFYREHAADFDRTRTSGWQGWERVRALFPPTPPEGRLVVGDFGCGNGRFARCLEGADATSYLGLDRSVPLLRGVDRRRSDPEAAVSQRARDRRIGVAVDLLADRLPLRDDCLDVAVAFGLFHHIPSFTRRAALLAELAATLRPGGRLIVSFWQFADEPRFVGRTAPSTGPWLTDRRIDPDDLEEGDFLLRWGNGDAVRYCHHATESEIGDLIAPLVATAELCEIDRWSADGRSGRLNRYLALERVELDSSGLS